MKVKVVTLVFILCFLAIVITSNLIKEPVDAMEDYETSLFSNTVIVIDAGHGGMDGGATGIRTGVREAEINLAVSLKLRNLLQSVGYTVVLTRADENALCKGKFSKQEDMKERVNIVRNVNPDYVISIHMNSYPDPSVKGAQVFYYPDSDRGKALASVIQEEIRNQLDPSNRRQVKEGNFIMLHITASPAVMVECGFLTCPEEEAKLKTEEYQNQLAYAIFSGIVKYDTSTQP